MDKSSVLNTTEQGLVERRQEHSGMDMFNDFEVGEHKGWISPLKATGYL